MLGLSEQHDLAPGAGGGHRGADQGVAADGEDDGVRAAAVSFGARARDDVLGLGVYRNRDAEGATDLQALLIDVRGQDPGAAARRQRGQKDADGALPDDQDALVRLQFSIATPLTQVLTGSRNVACSNGTSSGM